MGATTEARSIRCYMLKRQGIGGGLGAVLRLTHSFKVNPLLVGKEIMVERYLKHASSRVR